MKSTFRLCVHVVAAVLLLACAEELRPGIDSSAVPPKDVTYDQTNSTSTTLGFFWEVDDAIEAGAVSFTAQIIQDEEIGGDGYTGKTSQTFQASSRPNDGAVFNGLTENAKYYARVRANYPNSIYSDWVYVTNQSGKPAVIKLGTGVVDEGIETIVGASARVAEVSPSTAVIQWSLTDFANIDVDTAYPAYIELYKDESCSDVQVSWDITDVSMYKAQPAFIFSGLEPATDYWFVVEIPVPSEIEGEEPTVYRSEPLKVTTQEKRAVRMPVSASEGEIILYQDFGELIWGGDAVNMALGYSAEKRGSATSLVQARGWNPIGGDLGFYLCSHTTEMGLYNTIRKALIGSDASLADWAELREDLSRDGVLACRPGMLKMGAYSKLGLIVTPELSALTETATIQVSFKAAPFADNTDNYDPQGSCIRVIERAAITNNIIQSAEVNNVVCTFDLANDTSLKEYSFEIPNVTNVSRIAIGAKRAMNETGQHRMMIDDICIKVVRYGKTEMTVETPVISLAVDEGLMMASWQECSNGFSYDVEYRRVGDQEWIYAGNTTYNTMTVDGLMPETAYELRVRAKYSEEYVSQWSEAKSVTTPKLTSTLTAYTQVTTESQLGFKWYTSDDLGSDINNPYTLCLYEGETDDENNLVVQLILDAKGVPSEKMQVASSVKDAIWTSTTGPCFLFSGLKPSTSYTLKITNRTIQLTKKITAVTDPSNLVEIPASAKSGDIILYEDFSEILWGGLPRLEEFGYGMPGWSSETRGSQNRFHGIYGTQPLSDSSLKLYLAPPTTQYGLFSTMKKAVPNTRLKDWGAISESYEGDAAGSLCGMPGMLKLGAASSWVQIMTPELDCLEGPSTIQVSFDMCPYTDDGKKNSDPLEAVVRIFNDVVLGQEGGMVQAFKSGTKVHEKVVPMNSELKMTRYDITFENVAPGSRVAIGSYRKNEAETGQRRVFLDNVQITVK